MAVNLKIVSQVVASGTPGPAGKSAYQIAVDNGFQGTESEWLKELHPFKGWFDNVSELEEEHSAPSVGEYAYVKGATSSDPVKIYECSTESSWSDSGRTVDTGTVQTFRSGEAVNDVGIDAEPTAGSDNLVKSGGVYRSTPKVSNSSTESDLDIADDNGNVLARFKDGHFKVKNFDSRDAERTSFVKLDFLSKVLACKYSGKFMHISFDDTTSCISMLFSTVPSSIYDIPFFNNLKNLHITYGACFSCYVYVESLANVNNNYASEFQAAKNWLKWNFHTLNNKQYTSSVPINNDYNLGIQRLLIMCGNDEECLDRQMRANYWELSLDNALFVRNNPIHKSFIFCAKDAFSPSTGNYYLNDFQKQFVFNNGLLLDTNNQIIFVQTCARLDSDDYVNQSKNLIQTNIKWQKSCEVLNHEREFNLTRMTNFLQWAKETMGFQFGFFDNIYKII